MDEKDERLVIEAMRTQAKMTRAYYDALLEQQFSTMDALRLTMAWITRRVE